MIIPVFSDVVDCVASDTPITAHGRNNGRLTGYLEVVARLRGNYLDRSSLFLQLGQWPDRRKTRRADKESRRARVDATSTLLVPMGSSMDVADGNTASGHGFLPRKAG